MYETKMRHQNLLVWLNVTIKIQHKKIQKTEKECSEKNTLKKFVLRSISIDF